MKKLPILILAIATPLFAEWETLHCHSDPVARHEAGLVAFDGKIYLLGGRRINPVSIFDPVTKTWTSGAESPLEIHHFQPVVHKDAIWIVGAMTGRFPHENPVDRVLKYYPREDRWEWGQEIPEDRRRGGAGASIYEGKLYLSCGITRGHMGGFVSWFDALDLETGEWKKLPTAPRARDHFQSVVIGDKLYLAGGRRTSHETNELFNLTVGPVDVFDFAKQAWTTVDEPLPTPRAGNTTHPVENRVLVVGGESAAQREAHREVEALDTCSGQWHVLPSLNRGRHGTGIGEIDGVLYTASGSGNRGGSPELSDIEAIPIEAVTP